MSEEAKVKRVTEEQAARVIEAGRIALAQQLTVAWTAGVARAEAPPTEAWASKVSERARNLFYNQTQKCLENADHALRRMEDNMRRECGEARVTFADVLRFYAEAEERRVSLEGKGEKGEGRIGETETGQ